MLPRRVSCFRRQRKEDRTATTEAEGRAQVRVDLREELKENQEQDYSSDGDHHDE